MNLIKKNTYEQHDNEQGSFYKSSVKPFKNSEILENNLNEEICIIGGGLTGISSALHLAKKGYSVSLFEARKIGWGASGRNGGHLGIGMRKDQKFLEKILGINHAKELWKLGLESVDLSLELISNYNIDCAIQKGIISAGVYHNDEYYFKSDIEHMNKVYNFNKYKFLSQRDINNEINSKIYKSGLLNSSCYHINPLKFLLGLANELKKLNVKIYENTPITMIKNHKDGIKIFTNNYEIKAKKVVVGCNGYLDKLLGRVRNKFMPINNYIIATEPLGEIDAKKIIKNNYAVSDTRFIIDYYRFSEDWRMLFGGGETYTSNFMKNPIDFVKKRMLKVFPSLTNFNIDYYWGGTLAITVKRLPDFGSLMNDNLIYAHGYSGHGLALSTLSGKLIAEKISGSPERFNFLADINNISILGGDILRRPIYTSAIAYYKFKDTINSIF